MQSKETRSLVSCITTTYKKFNCLYQTLDSIFMQDYPNIEIIIGDDGSPDFPEQELKKYIEEYKGKNITNVVIHHEEKNRGTVSNCARCRELASGDYIMGIASDDRFSDRKVVSDVVRFFEIKGAQVVTCIRQFVDEQTDEKLTCMPTEKQQHWMSCLSTEKVFEKMASFPFISGSCTYYRKEFYDRMGKYDCSFRYIEDVPFYLKTLRKGEKIFFYPRISILYRYGGGISTTPNKDNVFRRAMYNDRVHYMKQEIFPYMGKMPWWRRKQMKVRMKRFELDGKNQKLWKTYLQLLFYSPVGTLVHLHYQMEYRKHLRIRK